MSQPPPALKQRTIPEIIDAAFKLYRENFASFLAIISIAYVPIAIVSTALMGQMGAVIPDPNAENPLTQEEQQKLLFQNLGSMGAFWGATVILSAILVPLAHGALTYAVSARYLNQEISLGRSYSAVGRCFWKYWGTNLLKGLIIGLGMLPCGIPAIFFSVWFIFVAEVALLEGIFGTDALGRSRALVRGFGWNIFGFGLLAMILQGMINGMITQGVALVLQFAIQNPVVQLVVTQAVGQIITLLIQPLMIVCWILMYYDLRIRKEAFDLEVLAKNMGTPGYLKGSAPGAA